MCVCVCLSLSLSLSFSVVDVAFGPLLQRVHSLSLSLSLSLDDVCVFVCERWCAYVRVHMCVCGFMTGIDGFQKNKKSSDLSVFVCVQ